MLVFLMIYLVLVIFRMFEPSEPEEPYTYAHLMQDLASGNIHAITITPSNDILNVGTADVELEEEKKKTVQIPNITIFMEHLHNYMQESGNQITMDANEPNRPGWIAQMLPIILISAVFIVIIFFVMQQANGGAGGRGPMNFGRSRVRVALQDKRRVSFKQVAGLEEEKEELAEIVDFLKAPQKYQDIGARIPRGVLLVGPPGTGKTYLARAVAGEANVPFYSISGSDFVEMFVGVGASRVRDLFEQAKRNPASIVIIDEIDAVGRRRGAGLGGGHDEREQTLNQLLVEMDGFGINEGVIVLAATNRPDILDPALLRPGRFDRRITVNPPDVKGREAVLEVHAEGKQMSPAVSLKTVAQTTVGFTPADLENLLNEAALLAARDNKLEVDMESIRKAYIKVGIGTEKKSRVVTEKERLMVAYHEAGHAICQEVLPDIDAVFMVSIIPTGRTGGYMMRHPGEERNMPSKKFMEQSIVVSLGGRAAEDLIIKDVTTGAAADIKHATSIARDMVVKYGMSDVLGPIQFGNDNEEVFLGRDFAHTRNYGEQVADQIDMEIKRIVEDAYNKALSIIETHIDVLHNLVDLLTEKERVSGDEVRALFPPDILPPSMHQPGLLE
ncbi:MAG: ATP-dependent zinc metalloprotease FtsH [Clostridiales bacterium]|jgi:cell division protease FtsH|nr:ATP-dependent zinc metalloprotease FtsH [Clostridiales bacterium]